MTPNENALTAFVAWYEQFSQLSSIGGALVVLEQLKEQYDLSIDAHKTRAGGQIRGVSGEQWRGFWLITAKPDLFSAREDGLAED